MRNHRLHATLCCLACLMTACGRTDGQARPDMTVFSGATMGTHYSIKVVAPPQSIDSQSIKRGIEEQLETVDRLMSTYREDSELSRLNRFDRAEWFPVSEETATVMALALETGELSGGALDVTIGPLVDLWHFGPDKGQADGIPSDAQIAEAVKRTGCGDLQVRLCPPAVLKKRADIQVDLSAVAKGFAVDKTAEYLLQCGMENFLVDVGGEVRAAGHNQSGKPWRLAIEAPIVTGRALQTTVPLANVAMATSGDYRNFFEENGTRYCHIIDPRSGRPVAHRLASVSVIDASCARADALATALLVLGPEDGYNLAVEHDLPALFIIREDNGFRQRPTLRFEAVGK